MQQIAPRYVPGDVLPTLTDLLEWLELNYPVFMGASLLSPNVANLLSLGDLRTLVAESVFKQALVR